MNVAGRLRFPSCCGGRQGPELKGLSSDAGRGPGEGLGDLNSNSGMSAMDLVLCSDSGVKDSGRRCGWGGVGLPSLRRDWD